ncbi:hypothetical protein EDC01DRAFT_642694 [Geopyxis carbonaria]|nr:hypothetical protein EDC01DRAFT_642694 [Geopyxis carbonaria]
MSTTNYPTKVRVHIVQASYGDSFVIEWEAASGVTSWFLIDGGPAISTPPPGSFRQVGYFLFQALNTLDIRKLDRVIITHNDHDHVNGIVALLGSLGDSTKPSVSNLTGSDVDGLIGKTLIDKFKVSDLVQWNHGYRSLNSSPPVFPISEIWFNDLSVVAEALGKNGVDGWCSKWLEALHTTYGVSVPDLEPIYYSGATDPLMLVLGPGETQFKKLFGTRDSTRQFQWHTADAAVELEAKPSNKKHKTDAQLAISMSRKRQRVEYKKTVDKEDKNLSSIMFEMKLNSDAEQRMLFTGDSTGEVLHENVRNLDKTWNPLSGPRRYQLMKVMHHGNARNCYISVGSTGESKIWDGCLQFFRCYAAKVYCISGDGLSQVPNPDTYVLKAICQAHEERFYKNPNEPKPTILLTNGCNVNQVDEMIAEMDAKKRPPQKIRDRDLKPDIIFLQRGRAYGSIDPLSTQIQDGTAWTLVQKGDEAGDFAAAQS